MAKIDNSDNEYINSLSAAILQTTPFRLKVILYIWLFVVAFFILWASFAQIDEIVRGDGEIVPSGENQMIQNLEGGIVKEIFVTEGQSVKKGDILIKIDNQESQSTFKSSEIEADDLKIQILRLKAQVKLGKFKVDKKLKKQFPELIAREQKLYDNKLKYLYSQIDILNEQKFQRKNELKELQTLKNDLSTNLSLIDEEINMVEPMVKKGIKSKVDFLKLKREKNSIVERYNSADISIPRVESSIKEIDKKILELKNLFKSDSQEQLNKATTLFLRLTTRSEAVKDQVRRTIVKSPVNGIVQKLYVHTVGGVVKPGEDIIEIVPSDATLWVEAKVKPSDIAFIYPGQKANVKVTAYDFSIYGGLNGKVVSISPDSIIDKNDNTYYMVYIKTEAKQFNSSKQISLIPGMTVNIDIITGKKSIMDYILKPILKTKQYMFTER